MVKKQAKSKPRIRKAPVVKEQAPEKEKTSAKSRVSEVSGSALVNNPVLLLIKPVFRALRRVTRWLMPRYFVNSWREVKQVTWPNRRETWRLTLAVFIFAVVFGGLVAGVDKIIDEIFKKLVLR